MPDTEIIVFGSRIHGTTKLWSDLDLAIEAESARDWNDISPAFRKAIQSNGYESLP